MKLTDGYGFKPKVMFVMSLIVIVALILAIASGVK